MIEGNGKILIRNCTTLHTLELNDSSIEPGSSGFLLNLELMPNPHFKDFSLQFHEKGDFALDSTTDDGNIFWVNYRNHSVNFVELHMKRYIDLNRNDNQCEEGREENKSHFQELNKMYLKNMNCTLPWLDGKSKLLSIL